MNRKADMHVHTKYSNSRLFHKDTKKNEKRNIDNLNETENLFKRAKKIGLDALAITDHDSIDAFDEAKEFSKKYGITFIPGIEVSSSEGDILGYGITKAIRKYMNAKDTIKAIHDQGGIAVAAHPFKMMRFGRKVRPGKGVSDKILIEEDFDGLEVFNQLLGYDKRALEVSEFKKIAKVNGSDAHFVFDLGRVVTVCDVSTNTVEAYIEQIKNKNTKVKGKKINLARAGFVYIHNQIAVRTYKRKLISELKKFVD